MKKAKLYVVVFAVLILTATVFAKDVIKVGVNPGPHEELMEIVKGILAEKGIELEIISFADFITPNLALADGSIDVNSYQHEPFLLQFNKDRKTDLVKLAPTIVFPISIYSQKVKSLSELKDKAIIAIPNDPTNAGRVLMLLEKAGLIKLKD
ncbi:MAG TPA: MetQ/NlpA family ABC transporter substrate-binding protein [Bacillota bacterium]|nr:MetQ/NlpA family ABC transporter substrate-binding protein [Bacillota bacterium]